MALGLHEALVIPDRVRQAGAVRQLPEVPVPDLALQDHQAVAQEVQEVDLHLLDQVLEEGVEVKNSNGYIVNRKI